MNSGQDGVVQVTREVFGYGTIDQFTYVFSWDVRASTYLKESSGNAMAKPPTLSASLQPTGDAAAQARHTARQRIESAWDKDSATNGGSVYEVQTVSVLKTFTGDFYVGFNNDETDPIGSGVALGVSASAADMKAALEYSFAQDGEGNAGHHFDVTQSDTSTAIVWSVTFTHPDHKGGDNDSSADDKLGWGGCAYDYFHKQCKRDPSHGHDCRQHDGTSRATCTRATELLNRNYNGATTDVARQETHGCTWDEGTQHCRQSARFSFECRTFDAHPERCGSQGFDFPRLTVFGGSVDDVQVTVARAVKTSLQPLSGTFSLTYSNRKVTLAHDVSAIGMTSALEDVLQMGEVTVSRALGAARAFGSVSWDVTFAEFSAIKMNVFSVNVKSPVTVSSSSSSRISSTWPTNLATDQTETKTSAVAFAVVTHSAVPHSNLVEGDRIWLDFSGSLTSLPHLWALQDQPWTVTHVNTSGTAFTVAIPVRGATDVFIGWGVYEDALQPGSISIGFAMKKPILELDTSGLSTSGSLTAAAPVMHAGSHSCCVSGSFKLAHHAVDAPLAWQSVCARGVTGGADVGGPYCTGSAVSRRAALLSTE